MPANDATLMHSAAPASTSSTTAIHRTLPRSPAPMAAPTTAVAMPKYGVNRQLEVAANSTIRGP